MLGVKLQIRCWLNYQRPNLDFQGGAEIAVLFALVIAHILSNLKVARIWPNLSEMLPNLAGDFRHDEKRRLFF
jgi:hypothetical protein